ncbi:hypothetical protein ANRL3_03011 [Anaerolineae bacterium]|nr:hypothetical protein ANRL3_03011 [Anaerolineae bacterium]
MDTEITFELETIEKPDGNVVRRIVIKRTNIGEPDHDKQHNVIVDDLLKALGIPGGENTEIFVETESDSSSIPVDAPENTPIPIHSSHPQEKKVKHKDGQLR